MFFILLKYLLHAKLTPSCPTCPAACETYPAHKKTYPSKINWEKLFGLNAFDPKNIPGLWDGYKVFSIRIKDETIEKINDLSKQTGRTRNELIGILLDFALEHSEVASEY